MDGKNRNKRAVLASTVIGSVGVGLSLIFSIISNIRQTLDDDEDEKSHQELTDHFEEIKKELEQQTEELRSINREIQKLGLSVTYSQHEEQIKRSLRSLQD